MRIQGEQVCLLKLTEKHLDFISGLECNQEVWAYEEFIETDHDQARDKYVSQMGSSHNHDFVIVISADGESVPIGIVQIWSYVEHRDSWEIGFGILPEYQGRGYGAEAARLLMHYAFHELNAHKVVGMCNSHNQRSSRLMEKLGFQREGIFKEELKWNGGWHDQYFYSILDWEWKAK